MKDRVAVGMVDGGRDGRHQAGGRAGDHPGTNPESSAGCLPPGTA